MDIVQQSLLETDNHLAGSTIERYSVGGM
jgi:hypothetical protein